MATPDSGPQPDYAIDPGGMRQGIQWYLAPVIEQLAKISSNYSAAHDEIKTAHDSQAPGWFGGHGNNEIQPVSSSFLNAAEWQLRQLVSDQAELHQSLADYKAMLEGHTAVAEDAEHRAASRFLAIDASLEQRGH
jgi:hypothetical protein